MEVCLEGRHVAEGHGHAAADVASELERGATLAPVSEVGFDMLGQLDTVRHAEPVIFFLTDDPQAHEYLLPPAEDATRTQTRNEAEAAAANRLAVDQAAFRRFAGRVPSLPDEHVETVVIERTKAKDAIVIPQAAVLTDQGGQYVLLVNDENKVETRRIETGQRFGAEACPQQFDVVNRQVHCPHRKAPGERAEAMLHTDQCDRYQHADSQVLKVFGDGTGARTTHQIGEDDRTDNEQCRPLQSVRSHAASIRKKAVRWRT